MERLEAYAKARLAAEEMVVLAGDYNVIPEPIDARYPDHWVEDALYQPETRARFRRLLNLGLTCAFRACTAEGGHYSFWDYQAGAWQRNNGIRIDHQLLSPLAADRLAGAQIDKRTRSWDKPVRPRAGDDRTRRVTRRCGPRAGVRSWRLHAWPPCIDMRACEA